MAVTLTNYSKDTDYRGHGSILIVDRRSITRQADIILPASKRLLLATRSRRGFRATRFESNAARPSGDWGRRRRKKTAMNCYRGLLSQRLTMLDPQVLVWAWCPFPSEASAGPGRVALTPQPDRVVLERWRTVLLLSLPVDFSLRTQLETSRLAALATEVEEVQLTVLENVVGAEIGGAK